MERDKRVIKKERKETNVLKENEKNKRTKWDKRKRNLPVNFQQLQHLDNLSTELKNENNGCTKLS